VRAGATGGQAVSVATSQSQPLGAVLATMRGGPLYLAADKCLNSGGLRDRACRGDRATTTDEAVWTGKSRNVRAPWTRWSA
jgi:hypothetical protein